MFRRDSLWGRFLAPLTLLQGLAACTARDDTPSGSAPDVYLGLEQPEHGFQVRSKGREIPPGADVEYCEVAELPGEPDQLYTISGIELGNAPYSHHLIVSAAVPGSPADAALRDRKIGDQVPCLSAETTFGLDGMEGVGGVQLPYGQLDFPPGVGREYRGGQRIVFDFHYYNTTSEPVRALSAVNFHVSEGEVTHLAREFGFSNWTIDTPPGEERAFTAECRFRNDIRVASLTRHTHRWGTDYSVWFAGGGRDGELIWKSTHFESELDHWFIEPPVIRAGEGFRFQCAFRNTETHLLRFGTNATDEMCILFGLFWSAGSERDVPSQSCDIVWTDPDGIGRSPHHPGYPRATPEEAALCLGGSAEGGPPADACTTCACNACGHTLIRCATDAECLPILSCFQGGAGDCDAVLDEHSSAVGLAQQMQICIESAGCDACGAR